MSMRIAILSADRSEYLGQQLPDGRSQGKNYAIEMLDSLVASGVLDRKEFLPIPIIVGTPSTAYLGKYEKHPAFQVLPMTVQKANTFGLEDLNTKQRCALNYIMLWRHAVETMEWDRLFVLEDDILISPGWMEPLERVLRHVDAGGVPPLVTAYRPLDRLMGSLVTKGVTHFDVSDPIKHWGMQGYVYHRSHFFDLAMFFKDVTARVVRKPEPDILEWVLWDHLSKIEKDKQKVRMVATCPCLMQHHGDESLVGSGIHRALHVLGDTVIDVDASQASVSLKIPIYARPSETFYVRRKDSSRYAVEVFGEKGARLATINGKGVFTFKKNPDAPPAPGRGGIAPGHPKLKPLRRVEEPE